jgi:hypothetical protein
VSGRRIGGGGTAPLFLTSTLAGGEWAASRLSRGTHWIGGWEGHRASLDAVDNRSTCPYQGSNPGRPSPYPSWYTDRAVSDVQKTVRYCDLYTNC